MVSTIATSSPELKIKKRSVIMKCKNGYFGTYIEKLERKLSLMQGLLKVND